MTTLVVSLALLTTAMRAPLAHAQHRARWAAEDEVFYQIFVRSFRDANGDRIGDLRGIQDKLGYLQELGVTSLLLTPINPSPTYHNYFASSFEGVDPAYGSATALHDLVEAVHARHMKIYLDEEIQYAVRDNPWLRQSLRQPNSPYSHYILYDGPGNSEPEPIVYGITALPTYDGASIPVATVNLRDTAVVQYFENLFASLVDPNHDGRFDDGVDGFRLDHMMDDLDDKGKLTGLFAHLWAPIFSRARAVNPRVRFIAEQADWGFGDDWLERGHVDLVFAFPLQRAIGSLNRDSIAHAITQTLERTPSGKGQLVFIENHDMNRFSSVHADPAEQRIGAALDVLLKGTPLIYYGQELGMKGMQSQAWKTDANDIPDREAFQWTRNEDDPGSAIWYKDTGPWWTNRYNQSEDGISVAEETGDPGSLLSYYRRLLALRRARPELRSGDERLIATDQPAVLAVLRSTGMANDAQTSLLLVNLSHSPVTTTVDDDSLPASLSGRSLRDLLSGKSDVSSGQELRVDLPPYGVRLLSP
ncbi:MAG: alpha-amylase family glycosyl hydrolase [Gemmatimonadaceae bacterium]